MHICNCPSNTSIQNFVDKKTLQLQNNNTPKRKIPFFGGVGQEIEPNDINVEPDTTTKLLTHQ